MALILRLFSVQIYCHSGSETLCWTAYRGGGATPRYLCRYLATGVLYCDAQSTDIGRERLCTEGMTVE